MKTKIITMTTVIFFAAAHIFYGCSKKEDSNPKGISPELLNNLELSHQNTLRYNSSLQMWLDSTMHCVNDPVQVIHCDSMVCVSDNLYHQWDALFTQHHNECHSSMMNGGGMMDGGNMRMRNGETNCDKMNCPLQVQQMMKSMDSLHATHNNIHPNCN